MKNAMQSKIIASTNSDRSLSDFHGGIHPADMKTLSNQTPITLAAVPPKLVIPVQQHIGKAAKIIVEVGQRVLKGQLIAQPEGFISVGVHASSSGLIAVSYTHLTLPTTPYV